MTVKIFVLTADEDGLHSKVSRNCRVVLRAVRCRDNDVIAAVGQGRGVGGLHRVAGECL